MAAGARSGQRMRISSIFIQPFDREEDVNSGNALDSILIRIGEFGRYQMLNYFVLSLSVMFAAMHVESYTLSLSPATFRCHIRQCDNATSQYQEHWIDYTIPKNDLQYDKCHQYEFDYIKARLKDKVCVMEYFSKTIIQKCRYGFKFLDGESTVAKEFKLICADEWMVGMAATCNNVGRIIGMIAGGVLADIHGRRVVLTVYGPLSCITGIILSFITEFNVLVFFEVFTISTASVIFPIVLSVMIESVGPERRLIAATIPAIFYYLGRAILGILANKCRNWRTLLRIITIPALLPMCCLALVPESVRWLLRKREDDKCAVILRSSANVNGVNLQINSVEHLISCNRTKLERANESDYPLFRAIKTFCYLIINSSICWHIHDLAMSFYSPHFSDNRYNNLTYNSLLHIPGVLMSIFMMPQISRRHVLLFYMIIFNISIFTIVILEKQYEINALIPRILGKLFISGSSHILYIFTMEIYPTNIRNSFFSIGLSAGIALFLLTSESIVHGIDQKLLQIPYIIFSIVSGLLMQMFPEVGKVTLPLTMDDTTACNDVEFC